MPTPKRVDELTTGTPSTSDYVVWSPTGGPSKNCTVATLLALGGVSSVNTLTGALTVSAGTAIGVSSSGTTITVNNNGVTAINTITGSVTLAAGTNITLTPSGSTITIAASGGASAPTVNAQTGTSYTLVLGDANNRVTLSNTSAITVTVPPHSSVAYPVGTGIDLVQLNTGQVTVAPGSGVTINATPGLKLRARYSGGTLVQVATDSWVFVGDTTP